jgi:hypothetical protein
MDFQAERLALLDRQPMPNGGGRYFYAPMSANIGITRRCNNLCAHCAPAASPQALEKVDNVSRFMLDIEDLPIAHLHIEGGEPMLEPDLVYKALNYAVRNRRMRLVVLETSASWATSPEETRNILYSVGFAFRQARDCSLLVAANLDHFHRAVPLENCLHLLQGVFSIFPTGQVDFSHTVSPGDETIVQFISLLDLERLLVRVDVHTSSGETVYDSLQIKVEGREQKILIENKIPVLVGRGKDLRGDDKYVAYRRAAACRSLDLREGHGFIFPDLAPGVWQILSLGWDGNIYPSAMFMHTGTLPIGDSYVDSPEEAIIRAQKDPILRALFLKGVGPIYRAALEIDPTVAELRDERLLQEELLFDLLADPERTLRITERLLSPPRSVVPRGGIKLPLREEIAQLFRLDLEGRERQMVRMAADLMCQATTDEIVEIMLTQEFFGLANAIYFTVIILVPGQDKKLELIRRFTENDELFAKAAASSKSAGLIENLALRRQFYHALSHNDSTELARIIRQAETNQTAEDVIIELSYELNQLELVDVLGTLVFSLSAEEQRSFFETLRKDVMTIGVVESLGQKFPDQIHSVAEAAARDDLTFTFN